jgi:hypothetical protein
VLSISGSVAAGWFTVTFTLTDPLSPVSKGFAGSSRRRVKSASDVP